MSKSREDLIRELIEARDERLRKGKEGEEEAPRDTEALPLIDEPEIGKSVAMFITRRKKKEH